MPDILAVKSKIINYIENDIWRIRSKNTPRSNFFFIKQLRIVILAVRGFFEDNCLLRASSLTFYSLLSIVPVVAMAFGIAKGFGFQKLLEQQLFEKFPGQEEVMIQIVRYAHSLLENTKGGMIAGIGLVFLFWSVIKLLGNIERSFNAIWYINKPRTFGRKFGDYLSIIIFSPLLVILSSSVTLFITTQISLITEKISLLGIFNPVIFFILKLLPYCLVWILFIFTYIVMPNTKVYFSSGFISGVIAGTIFQVVQWAYIFFQVGVARYNAIYGSFAALPLFLIWVQLSWFIVLFGAEISFAYQNVDTYEFEPDCRNISHTFKKLVSLQITHFVIKAFSTGEKPPTTSEITQTLEVPIRLVRQIVNELVKGGIFSYAETNEDNERFYQPARDINRMTIKSIIDALEGIGVDNIPFAQTSELKVLSETLQSFSDVIEKSPSNRLLKDI